MNYKNDDERMDDEKKLVLLCGILGFLDTDEQFYGVRGVTKDRKIAGNAITNIISKMRFTEQQFEKTRKKVEAGKLKVVVLAPQEMQNNKRKMLESETKINKGALITLQEHALSVCCDCTRKRSKCVLRTALLKSGAPNANDGNGKCQFNWTEE